METLASLARYANPSDQTKRIVLLKQIDELKQGYMRKGGADYLGIVDGLWLCCAFPNRIEVANGEVTKLQLALDIFKTIKENADLWTRIENLRKLEEDAHA